MKQNLDKSISVKIICLNDMQILTHGSRPILCVKNDTFNYALFLANNLLWLVKSVASSNYKLWPKKVQTIHTRKHGKCWLDLNSVASLIIFSLKFARMSTRSICKLCNLLQTYYFYTHQLAKILLLYIWHLFYSSQQLR